MNIVVLGSINIDKTYRVKNIVKKGETISSYMQEVFVGGKGFNQAVALSRAGLDVFFAGAIGSDGELLKEALLAENIDIRYLKKLPGSSGHSIIQIDEAGQNSIIISAGTNGEITKEYINAVIDEFSSGDLIVLQNEISNVSYAIIKAKECGLIVAYNPSPVTDTLNESCIGMVDYLLVNEVEGAELSGENQPEAMLDALHTKYPKATIILTLGGEGSVLIDTQGKKQYCGILSLPVVDTTAAGDTFTGYYLAQIMQGKPNNESLRVAAIASGISVSRKGASPSIPHWEEVCSIMQSIEPESFGDKQNEYH